MTILDPLEQITKQGSEAKAQALLQALVMSAFSAKARLVLFFPGDGVNHYRAHGVRFGTGRSAEKGGR